MSFDSLARWMIIAGLSLAGIGVLIYGIGKIGLPLGNLPGDIKIERGNFTCIAPIATSIILSLVLTLLLNLIIRIMHK